MTAPLLRLSPRHAIVYWRDFRLQTLFQRAVRIETRAPLLAPGRSLQALTLNSLAGQILYTVKRMRPGHKELFDVEAIREV
jgi:hypothetical protein